MSEGTWSHVHAEDGMNWVHPGGTTCYKEEAVSDPNMPRSSYDIEAERMQRVAEEPLLRYFEYQHLPQNLQLVSKLFHDLAHTLVHGLERQPERTVALRKLLESKDCAVRCALPPR